LLSFLGDIGGLDSTLEILGAILIGSFSKSNAYSHLVSLLFMQSTKKYQKSRSIMKPD
jgi:hypothetical protein